MSSRNAYLNPQERKEALVLSRSLRHVQSLIEHGERSANKLIAAGKQVVEEEPAVRLDYFVIVNPDTLDPVCDIASGALVAVAVYVGATRLIDNLLLPAI
jgi:pantoate--beta-alanine ligase